MLCIDYRKLFSPFIDEELDFYIKKDLKEHVSCCEDCAKELKRLKKVVKKCKNLDQVPLPINFNAHLCQKLRSSHNKENIHLPVWLKGWRTYAGTFVCAVLLLLVSGPLNTMYNNTKYTPQNVAPTPITYNITNAEYSDEKYTEKAPETTTAPEIKAVINKNTSNKAKIAPTSAPIIVPFEPADTPQTTITQPVPLDDKIYMDTPPVADVPQAVEGGGGSATPATKSVSIESSTSTASLTAPILGTINIILITPKTGDVPIELLNELVAQTSEYNIYAVGDQDYLTIVDDVDNYDVKILDQSDEILKDVLDKLENGKKYIVLKK